MKQSKTKPEAYTDVAEALTVAKSCDGRLINADAALCPNLKPGEVGYLIAASPTDLFDAAGNCWNVRVHCHRVEKGEPGTPDFRPGKYELFLELRDA